MEGFAPGEHRSGDPTSLVRLRMAAVAEIYQRIIYQQQTRGRQHLPGTEFKLLTALETATPDQSNQQMLERLAADTPALHEVAGRHDLSPQTRKNLYRFLTAAFTSSRRLRPFSGIRKEAARALALFEASEYLTEILIRHPEEIATLAEAEEDRRREPAVDICSRHPRRSKNRWDLRAPPGTRYLHISRPRPLPTAKSWPCCGNTSDIAHSPWV